MSAPDILQGLWEPIGADLERQGAPAHQRREMKKTFVAGVHRGLTYLLRSVTEQSEEGEASLEALVSQCERYVEGGWRIDEEFVA